MNQIKLVLLDLDGTIYNGDVLIDGAKEAIEMLQEKNINFCFLTNNTSISHFDYYEKLKKLGINIKTEQFITPVDVMLDYLEKNNSKIKVYGTAYLADITKKYQANNPDIIVIGTSWNFDYTSLKQLCTEISQKQLYFITNPDKYITSNESNNPDVGALIEYIYAVTNIRPLVNFGKPSEFMGKFILEKFGLEKSNILMIGDLLETDMLFAKNNEFQNALVLTGCQKNSEEINKHNIQLVFNNIFEAINYFFNN